MGHRSISRNTRPNLHRKHHATRNHGSRCRIPIQRRRNHNQHRSRITLAYTTKTIKYLEYYTYIHDEGVRRSVRGLGYPLKGGTLLLY